jgi:hypothetical protein
MEEETQAGSSSSSSSSSSSTGKRAVALAAERANGGSSPAPASQTCSSCGAEVGPGRSLLRCSRCQVVWYCNAQCQKDHWKAHKEGLQEGGAQAADLSGVSCRGPRSEPQSS